MNDSSNNHRRGDIYWIAADEARTPAAEYSHPHVVIQDDIFNRSRITTVIVCALTTNLKRGKEPGNFLLNEGEGGLPKHSAVVVSQVSSVLKSELGKKVGSLTDERVDQILSGMRFQQRAFFRD